MKMLLNALISLFLVSCATATQSSSAVCEADLERFDQALSLPDPIERVSCQAWYDYSRCMSIQISQQAAADYTSVIKPMIDEMTFQGSRVNCTGVQVSAPAPPNPGITSGDGNLELNVAGDRDIRFTRRSVESMSVFDVLQTCQNVRDEFTALRSDFGVLNTKAATIGETTTASMRAFVTEALGTQAEFDAKIKASSDKADQAVVSANRLVTDTITESKRLVDAAAAESKRLTDAVVAETRRETTALKTSINQDVKVQIESQASTIADLRAKLKAVSDCAKKGMSWVDGQGCKAGIQLFNGNVPKSCNDMGSLAFDQKLNMALMCNNKKKWGLLSVVSQPTLSSCHAYYQTGERKSGVYKISPGGLPAIDVFCDFAIMAGTGATMVLHSQWGGCVHSDAQYRQSYANWESRGVNSGSGPSRYAQMTSGNAYIRDSSCYFLPLRYWLALGTTSAVNGMNKMLFVSNNNRKFTMQGFHMTSQYGLRTTDTNNVRNQFCGSSGSSNCFINPPGFSASDRDQDRYGSACYPHYNRGWWFDQCFHYNAHAPPGHYWHYGTTVRFDRSANRWTWFVGM